MHGAYGPCELAQQIAYPDIQRGWFWWHFRYDAIVSYIFVEGLRERGLLLLLLLLLLQGDALQGRTDDTKCSMEVAKWVATCLQAPDTLTLEVDACCCSSTRLARSAVCVGLCGQDGMVH